MEQMRPNWTASSFVMKFCVPSVGDGKRPLRAAGLNFCTVKSCTVEDWQEMMAITPWRESVGKLHCV